MQSQPSKKWKPWHKWTLGILIGFVVLMAIAVNSSDIPSKLATSVAKPKTYDSLIGAIMKCEDYKVKEAVVKEDTLFVAVTNPTSEIKNGSANYFLANYALQDSKDIAVSVIYKYDASKSIAKGTYTKPAGMMIADWKRKEIQERWAKEYISSWDGSCRPLEVYLKERMNDADSYENVDTRYLYKPELNAMWVVNRFRGKNAFGGKVLNEVEAIISLNGTVIEVSKPK
jgi:hypothetical protein